VVAYPSEAHIDHLIQQCQNITAKKTALRNHILYYKLVSKIIGCEKQWFCLSLLGKPCSIEQLRFKLLNVWSENIKKALTEMKKQYALWVQAGKPRSKQNMTYQRRIKSEREFGIQVRIEQAIRNEAEKQRIRERPFNLKGRGLCFFSKKP
jgi:hypothetical protein